MRSACPYDHGVRVGYVKFAGAKNHSASGKQINMLVAFAVARAIKINKKYKSNYKDDSDLEDELNRFNFDNI